VKIDNKIDCILIANSPFRNPKKVITNFINLNSLSFIIEKEVIL